MLTEREKQLIAAYIPSPPDPELGFNEYYILDDYGQTPMYRLYDNKTDCRNRTHVIDYWEDLRRKQQEELK